MGILDRLRRRGRPNPVPNARPRETAADDVGLSSVTFIREHLQVDSEWMVSIERGFRWWAGPLAQTVWAEPCFEHDGNGLSRVHVRTDLFRGFDDSDIATRFLAMLGIQMTMSRPIRSEEDPSVVQLASSFLVHEQNEGWLNQLMSWVASIQVTEALTASEHVGDMPFWESAITQHPTSGIREELDGITQIVAQLVVPRGQEDSKWAGEQMEGLLEWMNGPPCVLATGGSEGVAAEYPFPGGTSLLTAGTSEPNPRLGNGVLVIIKLGVGGSDVETAREVLRLNELELMSSTWSHVMGSWCATEEGLCHASFFPNAIWKPGLLANLMQSAIVQLRHITEEVYSYDMSDHYEEAAAAWSARLTGHDSGAE